MPILSNPKHELFAQELAKGKTAGEAYATAGYKPSRPHASHLQHQWHISQRVAEILATREKVEAKAVERAIERTAITKERVLAELAKIGFANMADYMKVGPDGDPYLDFSALDRDQAAALIEVTVEDFKEGRGAATRDVRRVKFKLGDKRAALVDMGKEIGMFVQNVNLNATIRRSLTDYADAELATLAGTGGGTGGDKGAESEEGGTESPSSVH